MDVFFEVLEAYLPLSASEREEVTAYLEPRTYGHGATIHHMGDVVNGIDFIQSGVVRVFHMEHGKEFNTYFAGEHSFVTAFSSYVTQQPSVEAVACLTKVHSLRLSVEAMKALYKKIPKWERVGRLLAEHYYLCIADRVLLLQTRTGIERYKHFLETTPPQVVQEVPDYHIASFLGMAPESLSRIRRQMAGS